MSQLLEILLSSTWVTEIHALATALNSFVAKGRTLAAVFLPAKLIICMYTEKFVITDPNWLVT